MTTATETREVSVLVTVVIERKKTNRLYYSIPADMCLEELERELLNDPEAVFDGDYDEWLNGVKFLRLEEGTEYTTDNFQADLEVD